jgi:hypothetical protein
MQSRLSLAGFDCRAISDVDQLQAHFQSRLLGKVRSFQLVLQNRGLILQGQSHKYYAKQLAQHAVMEAAELPSVANEIEVTLIR